MRDLPAQWEPTAAERGRRERRAPYRGVVPRFCMFFVMSPRCSFPSPPGGRAMPEGLSQRRVCVCVHQISAFVSACEKGQQV